MLTPRNDTRERPYNFTADASRDVTTPSKFLSPVSLPPPLHELPNPSFQSLFCSLPLLRALPPARRNASAIVVTRDPTETDNPLMQDARRDPARLLYTFYFVTGREGKMMALSQHPVRLILIFTKKRKAPRAHTGRGAASL